MTLKTTKEQRDKALLVLGQRGPFYQTIGADFAIDLCHDADEARRLEEELYGMQLAYLALSHKSWKDSDGTEIAHQKEVAGLRAKLDAALTALAPFAHPDLCEQFGGNVEGDESIIFGRNKALIKLGDCRKAADLLAFKEQEKP